MFMAVLAEALPAVLVSNLAGMEQRLQSPSFVCSPMLRLWHRKRRLMDLFG